MKRWLKFGAFLAVILLLSIGGNVQAQQASVIYLVNTGGETFRPVVEGLVTAIAQTLEPYSITVSSSNDYSDNDIVLFLQFERTSLGRLLMYPPAIRKPSNSVSPILIFEPSISLFADVIFVMQYSGDYTLALNFLLGTALYSLERCDESENFFTQLDQEVDQLSGSATTSELEYILTIYRANCAILGDDFEVATSLFESIVTIPDEEGEDVSNYPSAINLAWLYLQQNRTDDAFNLMEHIVTASTPDFIKILILPHRAQLYALAFRYDDAIADMDAAIELDPDNAELYVLRANITLLIYEWDRVLADYNTAIELDPDYADAYFYRGVFYYTRTEYQLALDDLNHYLELAPDGEHATDATTYIEEIERTQEALDG